MNQRFFERQIFLTAFAVIFTIAAAFGSFHIASNMQREVLEDLQDVVKRQRGINNVRRTLPDIHDRIENLSDIYMMEGDLGLGLEYVQVLRQGIEEIGQDFDVIQSSSKHSPISPQVTLAVDKFTILSTSWNTALDRFETNPEMAVVELAIRSEPVSLELRSVLLPAIDIQNEELFIIAEEEYIAASQIESSIVLVSTTITSFFVLWAFFRLFRLEERRLKAQKGLDLMSIVMSKTDNGMIITNKMGQIQWVNAGFERLTGKRLELVIGERPGALLSRPEASGDAINSFRAGFHEKEPFVIEVNNYHDSGEEYWLRCYVKPVFDLGNEVSQFVAIVADVTVEKEQAKDILLSKERLQQAQKMEAIGRLAGGVAHDFNNLLSVLMISAEFLREAVEDNADALEDIKAILEAADRGRQLTNQLLALSRRQPTQPKVLEPVQLIRDMQGFLKRLLGEHINFELYLDSDSAPILIDPTHLEQVTLNLVVNARDAMPDGGTLTISVANVMSYLNSETPVPCVQILITDTGTGIEPEIIKNIFDPFFSTKKEGKGTGLGLATVYGIVKSMKGEVSVDSVVGEGTTFQLIFSAIDEPLEWPEKLVLSKQKTIDLKGKKVLLVEDEFNVRVMVTRILQRAGVDVISAEDPIAAKSILNNVPKDWHMDLLLSDVIMPRGNGFDLARYISKEYPDTLVVLMTGYVDEETVPQSELEDGWLLLRKPFSSQELLVALHSQLGLSEETEVAVE